MPRIMCNVTKNWLSVTTNHLRELVEKAGTEEALRASYVSRDARRLRKEGLTDEQILAKVAAGELVTKTKAPKKAGAKKVKKATKKPKVVKPVEPEVVEPDFEDADEDVQAFLKDETKGDASDKAV